ncbi:hypothetical protein GCM10023238_05690 [Streptomyces heliomycini]
MINSRQADALSGVVEQALAEGATALVRGARRDNLVEPSVLTGLPADSALLRQEVFGPSSSSSRSTARRRPCVSSTTPRTA